MSASPAISETQSASHQSTLHQSLHEVFGFGEFRALQEEAIRSTLEGRDVLVVMPTGAGKSLCYQLPAALTEGVTIVVSPLVALMRDQVSALQERTTFARLGVASLNSLQHSSEQSAILEDVMQSRLRLLYVAPERFRSPQFLDALHRIRPARFVVDEAHCISEWGHDFRPDFLRLKEVVESLNSPPLMAVTATATRRVQESIARNLGMREPQILVGGFNRPNLHFSVKRCKSDNERENLLERALPKLGQMGGSGLIYAPTRKLCESFGALAARALAPQGKKVGIYHAGLEAHLRNSMQEGWLRGEIHTLVATNAFGMGIDKPDVRFVVHVCYPDSPESYYQEAGRAGRDNFKSRCVILTSGGDRRLREYFIENDALTAGDVKNAFLELARQAQDGNVQIARSWWKLNLDWNETKTRLALGELERRGLIERLGERGDLQMFALLQREFPAETFRLIAEDLKSQREERYRRLDEMMIYCRTAKCRRRLMLDYFGDVEKIEHSFCCDNCDTPPLQTLSAAQSRPARRERVDFPTNFNPHNIHHILQGLDALWPHVGKTKLNQLLRGAASKGLEKFRTSACPLFGAFRGSSVATVDKFLDHLIEAALLHQADEEDFYVCSLTSAGREAWQLKSDLGIILPGQPRVPVAKSGVSPGASKVVSHSGDDKVFEKLKSWRRTQAFSENVPLYCVLPDRTLQEIAQMLPRDDIELRAITGIGDNKLRKYGAAILGVLKGLGTPVAVSAAAHTPVGAAPCGRPPMQSNHRVEDEGSHRKPEGSHRKPEGSHREPEGSHRGLPLQNESADTFLLLQEGHSIEEIARARKVKTSVVWGELEALLREGLLESEALEVLIPDALRQRIESALDDVADSAGLRPVADALNNEVDYGLIRCVMAARQMQELEQK